MNQEGNENELNSHPRGERWSDGRLPNASSDPGSEEIRILVLKRPEDVASARYPTQLIWCRYARTLHDVESEGEPRRQPPDHQTLHHCARRLTRKTSGDNAFVRQKTGVDPFLSQYLHSMRARTPQLTGSRPIPDEI